MPEPPAARTPRRDDTAADVGSLVRLGRVPEQPTPRAPVEPGPSPAEQANEAAIEAALTEAGIAKAGRDEQVIDALAKLDPAEVEAITRWVKSGKGGRPDTGAAK
ncbi:MAG: hypothetical protein HOZ81_04730 [Streptomyces sp.]|nr:hypothetical protein [Streptomyces sp.]